MKRSKATDLSIPRNRDISGNSLSGSFDMLDVSEIETIITVDDTLNELYIHTDPDTGRQFTNGMTNSQYIQWNAENGITLKEVRIDGEVLWYIPEEFIETPEQAKERVKLEAIHNNPDIMKRG